MERSLGDQFRITSCVSDGFILLRNAVDGSPDLIVADFEIPGIDGIEAAARLRSLQTSAKFVVVSPHAAPELIEEALEAGAAAYVLHRDVEEELLIAAHAALAGRQFISRSCR